MYTTITFEELKKHPRFLDHYKLCYLSNIDRTYSDYTPKTKEYMKSSEYAKFKEKYGWSRMDPRVEMKEYPNPDYIPFKQEMLAWFSPQELGDIWGDDFDDIPYECNSGCPYDNSWDKNEEVEIIQIPFCLPKSYKITIKEPKDYGYNSPFCTEDIILGAVPWIFARTHQRKSGNRGVAIQAGINPNEFEEKLKDLYGLDPDYPEVDLEGSCNGEQLFTVLGSDTFYGYRDEKITEYEEDYYHHLHASTKNLMNSEIIKEKINEYRKF